MAATSYAALATARRAGAAVARAAAEPGRGYSDTGRAAPEAPRLRAVRPDERIPRAPRPAGQRRLIMLIGAGLALALGLMANVAIHVQTTQGQFKLDRLQSDTTAKEVAYQKLRVEVAHLEAPQRIVAEAKRLGMVEPPEVRYLAPNGNTSVASPPSTAPTDNPATGGAGSWAEVKSRLGGGR